MPATAACFLHTHAASAPRLLPNAGTLAGALAELGWLATHPRKKLRHGRVRLQRVYGAVLARQFALGEQRVNLPVADAVQVLGMTTAMRAWHQMVCIALRGRDHPIAERAAQRLGPPRQAPGIGHGLAADAA